MTLHNGRLDILDKFNNVDSFASFNIYDFKLFSQTDFTNKFYFLDYHLTQEEEQTDMSFLVVF